MPAIVLHTDAAEEMQTTAAYYAARAPGLGEAFLDEIEQGLRRIQEFPRLWPVYEGAYRRYLLQRFPYGLIYRIDPEEILILAVAHLHRHPGYGVRRSRPNGAERLRDRHSAEAGRSRALCVAVGRKPLRRCRLRALGAVAVAPSMLDAV